MERFQSRKDWTRALVHHISAPDPLVELLWENPEALIAMGRKLVQKKCVRTTVRVDLDGFSLVIKRYVERSWRHGLKQSVMPSRAARCWNDTWYLLSGGYPTPRPFAYREARFGGLRGDSYFVYEFVEGRTLLDVAGYCDNQRLLRQFVDDVIRIWGLNYDLGVCLHDGLPDNFVVDWQRKMWAIDLDKLNHLPNRLRLRRRLAETFSQLLYGMTSDDQLISEAQRKLDELIEARRIARYRAVCDR
jgi:hypothetical protein